MSAIDFLDQWFETDVLKATMSASGIIGTFLGVRSPGRRMCCCTTTWGRLTARFAPGDLRAAARERFRMPLPTRHARRAWRSARKSAISQIIVKNGRAKGVVWRMAMRSMPTSFHPVWIRGSRSPSSWERSTLPGDFLEEINRYKFRGSSGKVNMALDGLPDFKCMPGPGAHLRGAISISPSRRVHGAGV